MYRPIGFSAQHEMELLEIDHERLKPNAARRYQCVWMRFALGMKAPRIAEVLNLNPSTVRHIQSAFMREGAKAILGRGNWGGRRHQYMTLEEECAFLHNLPFQRLPLISEPSSRILKRQSGGGWMPPPYADCSNAMAGAKPYVYALPQRRKVVHRMFLKPVGLPQGDLGTAPPITFCAIYR